MILLDFVKATQATCTPPLRSAWLPVIGAKPSFETFTRSTDVCSVLFYVVSTKTQTHHLCSFRALCCVMEGGSSYLRCPELQSYRAARADDGREEPNNPATGPADQDKQIVKIQLANLVFASLKQ